MVCANIRGTNEQKKESHDGSLIIKFTGTTAIVPVNDDEFHANYIITTSKIIAEKGCFVNPFVYTFCMYILYSFSDVTVNLSSNKLAVFLLLFKLGPTWSQFKNVVCV